MDLDTTEIQEICTEAVFERGQDYRDEGHVQRIQRFGDGSKSVEEYRDEIQELFNQHTQYYPVVTEAIDFLTSSR